MGWQVTVGEHAYHLLNMSVDEIDQLTAEVGMRWTDFYPSPFGNKPLGNAEKLLRHLAKRHDVEVPERLTPNDLFGYWELVDDDIPSYFTGGMPSDPKEETGSTSGSSSSPDGTGGPPTSSDDNPSKT